MLGSRIYIRLIGVFLGFSAFFLVGCGSGFEGQVVSFDVFLMDIGQTFEPTYTQSVENKRIKDRVIASYAYPAPEENPTLFEKNIIIATIRKEDDDLNLQTFSQVAIPQIQRTFAGYIELSRETIDFDCAEQTKQGFIHSFSFVQNNSQESATYYISQLYVVGQDTIFVVSAATDVESELGTYASYFKTIRCATDT